MSTKFMLTATAVLLCASPARAQFVVLDPANLVETILIAERTQAHLRELQAQYATIMRMSQALGSLARYRIPAVGVSRHEAGRWPAAQRWLQSLNAGDPTGAGYAATTVPLLRPGPLLDPLTAAARRLFERQYATVEIADSVATLGAHQVGALRGYHDQTGTAVQALEEDVLSGLARYHEMTAILDKVAAGELLGRRQDMAANQLLSHALEQLLARGKRQRDTEAQALNMQLTTWRDVRVVNEAMVRGAGDAIQTWRQP